MYNERRTDQAIVDYLLLLGAEVMQTSTNAIGADMIAECKLKYVLTVPAIWSERATQRTKRAFQEAMGLPSTQIITVISEPEAAAIYGLQKAEEQIIKEGDCLMILEAGGGTVDLISYVIRQLHPLVVDEVVPGSRDVCGGATVTDRFEKWLRSKTGDEDFFDDDVVRDSVHAFDTRAKTLVNSARIGGNETFHVSVSGLSDNHRLGISNELISVPAGDMMSFFQPSIERIKLLVAEQIAASNALITAIIMVGGYGQCQYLNEELEEDILVRQRRIQIHRLADAWSAVVQGAVMKGMYETNPEQSTRIRIGSYKARKHYGTELTVIYRDSVYAELHDKRRWDGLKCCYEVEVMDWSIQQGDSLTDSKRFSKNFTVTSRVNHGKPHRIYLIIYSDEASQVAPLSKTDTVRELCTVEADLSLIPESQIAKV